MTKDETIDMIHAVQEVDSGRICDIEARLDAIEMCISMSGDISGSEKLDFCKKTVAQKTKDRMTTILEEAGLGNLAE